MIPEVLVKEHRSMHNLRHAAVTLKYIGAAFENCCDSIVIAKNIWRQVDEGYWKNSIQERITTTELVTKYFESIKNK